MVLYYCHTFLCNVDNRPQSYNATPAYRSRARTEFTDSTAVAGCLQRVHSAEFKVKDFGFLSRPRLHSAYTNHTCALKTGFGNPNAM